MCYRLECVSWSSAIVWVVLVFVECIFIYGLLAFISDFIRDIQHKKLVDVGVGRAGKPCFYLARDMSPVIIF